MLPNPNYKSSLVLEHAGFVEFGLAREGKQVVNEMSKCMRMVNRVQSNYSRMSVFFHKDTAACFAAQSFMTQPEGHTWDIHKHKEIAVQVKSKTLSTNLTNVDYASTLIIELLRIFILA